MAAGRWHGIPAGSPAFDKTVKDLFVKTQRGLVRRRRDACTIRAKLKRWQGATGPCEIFLRGAEGDENKDNKITAGTCTVYLRVARQAQQDIHVTLGWDPRSYGGTDYNVGLAMSPDLGDLCTPLPIKETL